MKLTTAARILSAPVGMDLSGGGGAVVAAAAPVDNTPRNQIRRPTTSASMADLRSPVQRPRNTERTAERTAGFRCLTSMFSPLVTRSREISSRASSAVSRFRGRNDRTDSINGMNINVGVGSIGSSVNESDNEDEQESPVNAVDVLKALLEANDYNLFKVLLGGHNIDISLLGELENWKDLDSVLSALELEGIEELERVAGELNEFFIRAESKALALKYIKILVLFHFPPNNQNMERTGVLFPNGTNRIPINPTMEEFFGLVTTVITEQFEVTPRLARIIAMNSFVVVSAIPITLPHDAAGKATGTAEYEKYEKARDRSEEASVRHVKSAIRESGATHAIILGSYPWKFYKKHQSIFDSITVLQKFSLIHPSSLRRTVRNNTASDRQAFELSLCLNNTFAHLSDVTPTHNLDLEGPQSSLNMYITNGRVKSNGQFFYCAWYGSGTSHRLVFLEHSAAELDSLISKELGPDFCMPSWEGENTQFPKKEKLYRSGAKGWGIGSAVSPQTYQTFLKPYKHLMIGVVHWSNYIKDVAPTGSRRGEGITYQNITMGVQNQVARDEWKNFVRSKAAAQGRNSQLTARTSAPVPGVPGIGGQVVDGYDDF